MKCCIHTVVLAVIIHVTSSQIQNVTNMTTVSMSTVTPSPTPVVVVGDGNRVTECKVAFTVGYGYRRLYHWSNSLVEKKANDDSGASAFFHFRVRAFSDAHILLSPSPSPSETDPVYEIVLGAGRNSFSDIRRLRRSNTKATMSTPDIVSAYELRGFWIRLANDGTIEVGRENDDTAFIGWRDPQPLSIRYFAFCTWTGTVGKWEYDCPNNGIAEQVQEVEKTNMTWTEKLRRDLLLEYDPYVRPAMDHNQRTLVYLHLACQHVDLDDKNGVITVHGTMSMHWMDEKLTWSIENYAGLKTLHVATHEVWLPELLLFNAADGTGDNVFDEKNTRITVTSDGAVMWSPQVRLQALCALNLSAWPQDRHTCSLQLGVWSLASFIELKLMENGTDLDDQYTMSQWQVEDVSARHVWEQHPWVLQDIADDDINDEDNEYASHKSVFSLEVTVKRKSSVYHTVLLTPVLAATISMFASFWISPLSWSRLTLCCMNLLLITSFTAGVAANLPVTSDSVPRIISVLSGGFVVGTAALMATILAIRMARCKHQHPPPRFITDQLDGILGVLLLVPPPPQSGTGTCKLYDTLEDTKELHRRESTSSNNAPSISPDVIAQIQWIRLANAIDHVLSLIYCISLALLFI